MENLTEEIVYIIANAGDSRSKSMGAIEAARESEFETAESLLADSRKALLESHNVHKKLLVEEANGEDITISMLLIHASNHLSEAELCVDLATEIVELYRSKFGN